MKGNRLWLLGSIAAIATIVVLGWVLGISPKLLEVERAAAEQATVDQGNLAQQAALAQLKEQGANLDEVRAEVKKLQSDVPDEVLSEDFVDQVTSNSLAAGVVVKRITLGEATPWGSSLDSEGGSSTADQEGSAAPPYPTAEEGVYTVSVTIEVVGEPLQVIAFSRLMQEGPRVFLNDTFSYAYKPDQKGTLTGYLFVYRDPTVAPPAEVEPSDDTTSEPTPTPTPSSTETSAPTETPTPTETPAP